MEISAPLQGLPAAPPDASRAQLAQMAQDFEAMVIAELLSPMFDALDTEGLGGGGFGEQMMRPMLVQEYAAGIARTGGVGLADAVLAELLRAQAAATPAAGG